MGGCASVPKEFLHRAEAAPIEEAPAKVEQPEPETAVAALEDKTDGGEEKEAPSVEVSEPEKEAEVVADQPTAEVTTQTKVEAEAKTESETDKTDAPLVTV